VWLAGAGLGTVTRLPFAVTPTKNFSFSQICASHAYSNSNCISHQFPAANPEATSAPSIASEFAPFSGARTRLSLYSHSCFALLLGSLFSHDIINVGSDNPPTTLIDDETELRMTETDCGRTSGSKSKICAWRCVQPLGAIQDSGGNLEWKRSVGQTLTHEQSRLHKPSAHFSIFMHVFVCG